MKYIDAGKLKEMMLPSYEEAKMESHITTDAVKWEKVEYIFDFIFHLIDSLQQEQSEVDLDELINDFLLNNSEFLVERDSKAVVQKLARHFFELGYSLRKMNNNESDQKIRWKRN